MASMYLARIGSVCPLLFSIFFLIPPSLGGEAVDVFGKNTLEPSPTIAKKVATLIRHEPGHRNTIGGSFSPESLSHNSVGADETPEAIVGVQKLSTSACSTVLDALLEVLLCVAGFAIAVALQKMLRRSTRNPRTPNRRIVALSNCQAVGKMAPTKKNALPTTTTASGNRRRTDVPLSMQRDDVSSRITDDAVPAFSLQSEIKSLVTAINRGRAEALPQLLDMSLLRIEGHVANRDVCVRHAEELLVNVLRACASYGAFSDAIAAYDCVSKRIGSGDKSLWSLLLYVTTEAGEYSRGIHFYSNLWSMAIPSGNDLVNIVRCLAHEGDLKSLEQILEDLKQGIHNQDNKGFDNVIRNRALSACSKKGVLGFAVAVARSNVFNGPLDAVAYNTLMTCFAREGQFEQVLNLYEEMKGKNVKRTPVTFGVLIDACVSSGDFDRAKTVVREMNACGLSVNAVHCTSLIKGLIGAGRIAEAEQLFSEMLVSKNAKPDIITYSTLVKAYGEQGNVKAALRILEGMQEQGISPDEIICNAIFSACAVHPLSGSEIHTIVDRVATASELKPSTITLSIVLKAFATARAWQSALEFLTSVPDRFSVKPEIRLYLQLAQDCVKTGDSAKVLDIHNTMVEQLHRFGEEMDETVSKRLLRQCNCRADNQFSSRQGRKA